MFEATKANFRRQFDRRFATTYFVGNGLDIGCGQDIISRYAEWFPLMKDVRGWDQVDGDGMVLNTIQDNSYDFIHSSHSLEHMSDPYIAMENWLRVLKPGGHLILTVPDEDMFEQGIWPSRYAGADHITSWTIYKKKSWSPKSINVFDFFTKFDNIELLKIEKIDISYLYSIASTDQTRTPITECAIEVILRKMTLQEIQTMGKLPPAQYVTFNTI